MANKTDQSFTSTVRQQLDSVIQVPVLMLQTLPFTESMYDKAAKEGMDLETYVYKYPDRAVREAELTYAEWLKMQESAAVEGCIRTNEGEFAINKNTTKLLELRVNAARAQLQEVREFRNYAPVDGEKLREQISRVLLKKARGGDMRAIEYAMNRLDGRPGETKVTDLDYDNSYNVYMIVHSLFDKQLEVLNSGPGTKLICCTRRAGKSHLLCAAALIECLRVKNTTVLYIGQSQEQTEIIMDSAMNTIIDKCALRDASGKRLNWRHLDNGSRIIVRGLTSTKDPDIILGHKAPIIIIDEFFHLKGYLLQYLVREVLRPMQMDYATSYKFICAGTPPPVKGTYGEKVWKEWDAPHFVWSWEDNPFPIDPAEKRRFIEEEIAESGLTWETPSVRRNYGGEWVYDEDLLLYPEYHVYDPREAVPQFHIDQVLFGIDYGVSDNDTLIGIAWDNAARRGYVFHEDKFNRLDIKDRTISQLEYLRSQVLVAWEDALKFFPSYTPREANKRILWDADDSDQHLTDDFNINCRLSAHPDLRLNIQNAHKTDTVFMHDKIRDLLRTASLLLPVKGKTAAECDSTVLKRGPDGQVYPEIDMKTYHPDLLPAMRYALWNVIGQEG